MYSNTTILAVSEISAECNSLFSVSSVETNSIDNLDQEILFYTSLCVDLKTHEILYDKQTRTFKNWTYSLRLFDNTYWAMGTRMTFDVNATVLAGQSSQVYVCVFDSVQYFTQFIDNENWDGATKYALNCSMETVNSVESTPAGSLKVNVAQPGYFYVGLRPTNNLASLDIHMYGSQFYFNRSDYRSTNCSVAWEQPCTFGLPASSGGSEQCIIAYAVPHKDVSRGYSTILFKSPTPKGPHMVFLGTSIGLGSLAAVVLLLLIVWVIHCAYQCYCVAGDSNLSNG